MPETLTPRVRRAIGLMTIAVVVIVGASFYYLRPWEALWHPTLTGKIAISSVANIAFAYAFQSSALGWVMEIKAADTGGEDGQFWIWRTVDGAKHWDLQLHDKTLSGYSTVESFKFVDARTGFVVGSAPLVLYRTEDGGAHWTRGAPLPMQDAPAVQFVDAKHGWLSIGSRIASPPVHVWLTADAGGTWVELPTMPADAPAPAVFRDGREGWSGASSPDRPHAYTTADGGWTWRTVDVPATIKGTPERPAWTWIELPPGHGVVAYVAVEDRFETMTSQDGGATWHDVGLADGLQLNTISYMDAQRWWGTVGERLYKSEDAGNTWALASNLPSGTQLFKVLDSRHAWAVPGEFANLALTSDGGGHWTELRATLVLS